MKSLSDLADIWVPEPVPLWPISTMGMLLCAALIVLLVYWWWRYRQHQAQNRYRQHARKAIDQASSNGELADLLKRTALVAYPRTQVARLTGPDWCDWLEQELEMPEAARMALLSALYQPDSSPVCEDLRRYCQRWVRRHQGDIPC